MEEYLCAEEDDGVHVDRVLDYSIIAGYRLLTWEEWSRQCCRARKGKS
jgi:hypothetical protein